MSDSTPEPYTPTIGELRNLYTRGWVTKRAVISRADESLAIAEFDRFMSGYVRKPSREELSEFLFTIYDHGTLPNALREADAILTLLERTDR